eukprot:7814641-Alexandrium_andersonii.AAC.1
MDVRATLGSPPREASPSWAMARSLLACALRACGCRQHVRSPLVLWRLLRAGPPPRRFTWGQLAADAT